ncbi:hypothetical protein ACTNB0_16835 [Lachnospiraceae bacterium HCP28S3_F9]
MAKRVTPVEIEEMNRLYVLYGTYAEVGRMMKRSGSTVARYISKKKTDKYVLKTVTEVIEV